MRAESSFFEPSDFEFDKNTKVIFSVGIGYFKAGLMGIDLKRSIGTPMNSKMRHVDCLINVYLARRIRLSATYDRVNHDNC